MTEQAYSLADHFRWDAAHVFADSSPLYAKLANQIADDPEMLALAAVSQPHQPYVNLLFAAVHYLLLRDPDDPLALFYADLARKPVTDSDPYPIFRAYSLEHAAEITALVGNRRVQTNEVARCALFLPAFELVARRSGHVPCAFIEVGSSAGLNLNWQRYGYDYGDRVVRGNVLSTVLLECVMRGDLRPPLPNGALLSASSAAAQPLRLGIDLHPNDVNDDDAMLWLRALVWPEQVERGTRLARAIAIAREHPPQLVAGDALELAFEFLPRIPATTPVILFHSFVLNQVSSEARAAYHERLGAHSRGRVLYDIAIEPEDMPAPLVLSTYADGTATSETLARCDHHGRWLEWTADTR